MDDHRIIELYYQRSEQAIAATASKFGYYCYSIAYNILYNQMDCEECVSDTYLDAWNSMPPHRPGSLRAFLGRIARRNALDRWEYVHAEKRGRGVMPLALDELSECISSTGNPELEIEFQELGNSISSFVRQLPQLERCVFIRRYWYLDSVKNIAHRYGFSNSKIKSMLHRTRKKLREHLEKEGIVV